MLTFNPEPYELGQAILLWLGVVAVGSIVALAVAVLIGLIVGGTAGVRSVFRGVLDAIRDLMSLSPGRVVAISQLTFREALRRKALLVFVIFAVLFMFAGWFLTSGDQRPVEQVQVLVSFVFWTLSILILPVALLLACWGLPEDIRRRSLHTVVTKPVRRSEIMVGRIVGYVGINTLVLLVMGIVGYVWILRQVPSDPENPDTAEAQAALVSRVPVFGDLHFLDKNGEPQERGINVGDIWEHRSYIEGSTPERAVYLFEGVTPDALSTAIVEGEDAADGPPRKVLRLESTFEAFRTHKGDMDHGLFVQYTYVNPDDPAKRYVDPNIFSIDEFQLNLQNIRPKLPVADPESIPAKFLEEGENGGKVIDLFEYLAPEGKLRVEVAALAPGQYLGMAPADLFLRLPDRRFASGYFKAVFAIWLMTVLVVVLGVTASTFLKGPVATLLTFVLFIIGSPFREFMDELAFKYQNSILQEGQNLAGGGPLESIVRILQHKNPTTELPDTIATNVIQSLDHVFLSAVWLVRFLVPDFSVYNLTEYVANGFDIGWTTNPGLLQAIFVTLAFLIPCIFIGYFSLRFRELESK